MDGNHETLPDEDAEASDFTESDWLADLDRYYQDEYPEPRRPDEFTVTDWRDEMTRRRGQPLHRNQAATELERLLAQGRIVRRRGKIDGKICWLYSFKRS